MIADFGLSRIMEEEKLNKLTEICGTPGVCTPHFLFLVGSEEFIGFCSTWLRRYSRRVSLIDTLRPPYGY